MHTCCRISHAAVAFANAVALEQICTLSCMLQKKARRGTYTLRQVSQGILADDFRPLPHPLCHFLVDLVVGVHRKLYMDCVLNVHPREGYLLANAYQYQP